MHVNPLYSDGILTAGYDDDGIPGTWIGNMAESVASRDFFLARLGTICHDGNEEYHVEEDSDGQLYWADADGQSAVVNDVLRNYGAR